MTIQQYSLVAHDWLNLEFIINDLASRVIGQELGTGSSPMFAGLTLTGLTASLLLATDANKKFESVADLTAWIIQSSANQVIVTDNGDGTVTLSTPQNIHIDATPEWAGTVIKDSGDAIIFYVNNDEMYFTAAPTVPVTGNPIGLLLVLTYTI